MPASKSDLKFNRKWPPVWAGIFPLWIGLLGLYRVMVSPQFESYRSVDVIQLLVSGAGIGVALTFLMIMLVRPHAPDANLDRSAELEANAKKNSAAARSTATGELTSDDINAAPIT
jgi:hypothetical protein